MDRGERQEDGGAKGKKTHRRSLLTELYIERHSASGKRGHVTCSCLENKPKSFVRLSIPYNRPSHCTPSTPHPESHLLLLHSSSRCHPVNLVPPERVPDKFSFAYILFHLISNQEQLCHCHSRSRRSRQPLAAPSPPSLLLATTTSTMSLPYLPSPRRLETQRPRRAGKMLGEFCLMSL